MNRDDTRTLLAHAAATTRDWAPTSIDVDMWHELLHDLAYDDCLDALKQHARTTHHRPVPADIRSGVKRIRADRLERAPYTVPAANPDDVRAYLDDLRSGRTRDAGQRALDDQVRKELTSTFRDVPAASPAAIEAARDTVRRIQPSPRRELIHTEAVADMDRLLAEQAHRDLDAGLPDPTTPAEQSLDSPPRPTWPCCEHCDHPDLGMPVRHSLPCDQCPANTTSPAEPAVSS